MSCKKQCALCNCKKEQKGGSQASDAVVSLVKCETYEAMNAMASNTVTGGGKQKKKRIPKKKEKESSFWAWLPKLGNAFSPTPVPKKKTSNKKRMMRGGDCDTAPSTSVFDSYAIGPATVPTSVPSTQTDAIDYQNVTGSVLKALSVDVSAPASVSSSAIYPAYLSQNQISVNMMKGGSVCNMCS